MLAYVFFKGAEVVHVVLLGEDTPQPEWADRFCRRRGYERWETTDGTDMAETVEEIDGMYAEREQAR